MAKKIKIPKTPEELAMEKMAEMSKTWPGSGGAGSENIHPSPSPEFDPNVYNEDEFLKEQRFERPPRDFFHPDTRNPSPPVRDIRNPSPPVSIDRKFGAKNSQYRGGMPTGTELPAMILRDEPGYEEDEPIG